MLKTYPYLLCSGLLFWAWFVDHVLLGILFSGCLILSYGYLKQWQSQPKDFHAIADLCTLMLLGFFIFFFINDTKVNILYRTVQILPIVFLPLLLAQVLSRQQQTPTSAFLYRLRQHNTATAWVDIRRIYLCICLLATGTSMANQTWYLPISIFLVAWLLGMHTPHQRNRPWLMGFTMLILAIGLAYVGQVGLQQAHQKLGKQVGEWMSQWLNQGETGLAGTTALGQIGQLKLSDRIILRIHPQQNIAYPLLLRTSSFDHYMKNTWFATHDNTQVMPEKAGNWQLSTQIESTHHLEIYQSFTHKRGLIPLPLGIEKISTLYVDHVSRNRFKRLSVQQEQGLINYRLHYNPAQSDMGSTDQSDLHIPAATQHAIASIAKQLQLHEQSPEHVIASVTQFFQSNFQYSTWLQRQAHDIDALSDFLLHHRQGHCEYFATATVLLLRQAGIPARYAVGFSVQEKAGDMLLVRGRDAHAWVLAYINGQWINIDTTPANWFDIENKDRVFWQWASDTLQQLQFMYDKWQLSENKDDFRWWLWLALAILLIPAWKIIHRLQLRSIKSQASMQHNPQHHTAFHALENYLHTQSPRQQHETLYAWIHRLQHPELKKVMAWQYRLRFSKKDFSTADHQQFTAIIKEHLALASKLK